MVLELAERVGLVVRSSSGRLPHLDRRVALRDQPRRDACRHVAHRTGPKTVERHAVELALTRRSRDSDLHLFVHVGRGYTIPR